MKDPAKPDPIDQALGWLREPRAGRVAALATVVALAVVAAMQVATGGT